MSHDLRITARAEKKAELAPTKFTIRGGSKLEVFDEEGGKLYEGEFKSFTANFLKLLYGSMIGAGTAKAKDLSNSDVEMNALPQTWMNLQGGADVRKFGVVVGTNTAAVSVSDYSITVPSGLTLNATAVGASSVGADSISVEISRQIGNSTGSTVNLKEAGLICGLEDEEDSNVLIARDILDITLENGKKSVWRYTINFNFANDSGGFVKTFADKMFSGIFKELTNSAAWSVRDQIGCVVFQNKIWVLGGAAPSNKNDVWYSSDGISWTQATTAPWSARKGFGCVVFQDKIWVLGGYASNFMKDVWYSSDGISWTQATTAPWSARYELGCIVFQNKIWVLGGADSSGGLNDVWYSSDGISWTRVTSSAAWPKRYGCRCIVFQNKIWVLGGTYWSSEDGTTWTQVSGDSAPGADFGFTLNEKLFVVRSHYLWSSEDGTTWTQVSIFVVRSNSSGRGCQDAEKIFFFPGRLNNVYYNDVWSFNRNIDTCDLLPGSSDSAFSATGTALGAVIADGNGSGELVYGAMPGEATQEPTTSGNKTRFSIAREFTNNSGANITVREVGLFSGSDMLARLILAQPVTIANGESEVISVDFETEV